MAAKVSPLRKPKATAQDNVEHDLQKAAQRRWESRKAHPNFKTDPVWFGLRVPGTKR